MDFISTKEFDNDGERIFWEALNESLESVPGYCWHKYPITNINGRRFEPDILVLHREWGLNVIEVKGCFINQIETIEGPIWYMKNWYREEIAPMQQADRQMWAIVDRLKEFRFGLLRDETGYCKVSHIPLISLPFISEPEFREKFSENISVSASQIIFSTDLRPERLKQKFIEIKRRVNNLSQEEWEAVIALLTGSEAIQQTPRRPTKKDNSKAAWLRQSEQKIKAFDLQQHKVAVQVPAGPQRIRGLAGTGKTVVIAQKAANMHVNYPDWDIVVTFFSRSLYGQITNYIKEFQ